jgi:TetR/AcrR family transcriptional repressor of nem operon
MRYPVAETAKKHERIIKEGARLFRERGYAGVTVAEVMKASGLTHGPFYNHFASKQALMSECVDFVSKRLVGKLETSEPTVDGRNTYLAWYLSSLHRDDPSNGCILAAIAPEAAGEKAVKSSITSYFKSMVHTLATRFPWPSKRNARSEAISIVASIVGAVILARAVDDEALSDEILRAVSDSVLLRKK